MISSENKRFLFRHAIVEELAGFGAAIHTCSRNETELNKCLQQWRNKGFVVTGSVIDAAVSAQRVKLMEEVGTIFNGRLNILVSTSTNLNFYSLSH